jgi:proteasome lid subunit RPN8/RPN11
MKWNNLKPDIAAIDLNSRISKHISAIDKINLISSTQNCPLIIIPQHIKKKIILHLSTKKVELGGLLIGSVISTNDLTQGIVAIEIKEAVASNNFESSAVSLTMSSDIWQDANKISTDTTFVVGWYHSHPDLGAFFSGTDRKTQKDFFHSAYSLGLVIDPIRHEEKWFLGANSNEVKSNKIRSNFKYGLAVV